MITNNKQIKEVKETSLLQIFIDLSSKEQIQIWIYQHPLFPFGTFEVFSSVQDIFEVLEGEVTGTAEEDELG